MAKIPKPAKKKTTKAAAPAPKRKRNYPGPPDPARVAGQRGTQTTPGTFHAGPAGAQDPHKLITTAQCIGCSVQPIHEVISYATKVAAYGLKVAGAMKAANSARVAAAAASAASGGAAIIPIAVTTVGVIGAIGFAENIIGFLNRYIQDRRFRACLDRMGLPQGPDRRVTVATNPQTGRPIRKRVGTYPPANQTLPPGGGGFGGAGAGGEWDAPLPDFLVPIDFETGQPIELDMGTLTPGEIAYRDSVTQNGRTFTQDGARAQNVNALASEPVQEPGMLPP